MSHQPLLSKFTNKALRLFLASPKASLGRGVAEPTVWRVYHVSSCFSLKTHIYDPCQKYPSQIENHPQVGVKAEMISETTTSFGFLHLHTAITIRSAHLVRWPTSAKVHGSACQQLRPKRRPLRTSSPTPWFRCATECYGSLL